MDIKKAQELTPTEDKMISKSVERIKKEVLKAKDQEKKTWSKAFNNKK